jgi:hypothetical protein
VADFAMKLQKNGYVVLSSSLSSDTAFVEARKELKNEGFFASWATLREEVLLSSHEKNVLS